MPQFTKGHAKQGGRKAGTPNKTTQFSRDIISNMLEDYQNSGLMSKDFLDLEPKDRMMIAERMMQYILPKLQSVEADINASSTAGALAEQLARLSKEND